jgi:hypothetical protein
MGFEGFFFGRIDYQDQYIRNATKNLEFIWRPVKSYGNTADMFTGVLYGKILYATLPRLISN